MMAAILAPEYPGSTIVTDSVTSDRLTRFLEGTLGLHHHRFKRGYKNVINESIRLNNAGIPSPLAIETSGHGALSENYFLDDGAYLAVRLLIAAAKAKREGRALGALIERLPPACEEAERRIPIEGEDFAATGKRVLAAFEERRGARLCRRPQFLRRGAAHSAGGLDAAAAFAARSIASPERRGQRSRRLRKAFGGRPRPA